MKKLVMAAALALVALAGSANAADKGWYLQGNLGLDFPRDVKATNGESDLNNAYALGAEVGYRFNSLVRTGLEVGYLTSDFSDTNGVSSSGSNDTLLGMVNVYVDVPTGTRLTPFVGAGVGLARTEFDNYSVGNSRTVNDSDTNYAYQLTGGVSYAVTKKLDVVAGYKYLKTGDVEMTSTTGGTFELDNTVHHLVFTGARYTF